MLKYKCGVGQQSATVKGELCLIMEVAQRHLNQEVDRRGHLWDTSSRLVLSSGRCFTELN